MRYELVTVQPLASLLRNLPIPSRLWRGADSFRPNFHVLTDFAASAKSWAELLHELFLAFNRIFY